jgi:hypothetical protein
MNSRFRRSGALTAAIACAAVAGTAGCEREPSAAAEARALPHPQLCQSLDRAAVGTALGTKVTGCVQTGTQVAGFETQFTGGPAILTVTWMMRYDLRSGADRWSSAAQAGNGTVELIGVGDDAAFDADAAPSPQLVVLKGQFVLTVGLRTTTGQVSQNGLSGHLMDVALGTLALFPAK